MRFSKGTGFALLAALYPIAIFVPPASAQFVQQGPKIAGPAVEFGYSVALSADGNTAIVGGPMSICDKQNINCQGEIWPYTRTNGVWTQQGLPLTGNDTAGYPMMGQSVALSADGNTAIVGGPFDNIDNGACYAGAAWIFVRVNTEWFQQGSKLVPAQPPCSYSVVEFGLSVGISADGNTAIVGGPGGPFVGTDPTLNDGGAWVFSRTDGVWTQQGKLLDKRGVEGSFSISEGWSVALSGDGTTAFVGDNYDNGNGGGAWVFTYVDGGWIPQGNKLPGAGLDAGESVALSADGNTGLVGGNGSMTVFTRSNNLWSQQGAPLTDTSVADPGTPVALSADGNTAITGAAYDNIAAGAYFGVGAALVFTRDNNGVWSELGNKLVGTGYATTPLGEASQGWAVAVSGDGSTVMVGGPNDNEGTGAVWAFTRQAPSGPAAPGGANPASGSGLTQSMSFTFNDPRGWQDLDVVNVLINSSLDGRSACYLAYSRSAAVLYLLEDNGGTLSTGLALGGAGSVSNSRCTIAGAASAALGSGNTLTLTLNMTFSAGFGGNQIVYLAARDLEGGNSGWQAMGTWQVPYTPSGTIAVVSLTPPRSAAPSGTAQTFTAVLTDSKGTGDFGVVNLLLNNFIDGRQACYLAYAAAGNSLLLVDDGGDAGGPFAGSMLLNGSAAAIQNSQCSVSGTGSSAVKNGNTLTLTLSVIFKSPFAGNHIVWVAGRDAAGANNTGWQAMGTTAVE